MEDRLSKFARLVDAGGFTKAADLLHISQPALTTAVKKLERELGVELLVRTNRTFKLTTAGEITYAVAKDLNQQTHDLKRRLQETANEAISLQLGMIDSLATILFVNGKHLQQLEQGTHLSLTIDNSTQLVNLIENDELDMALIARPHSLPSSLTSIAIGEEPLVLVTHIDSQQKATEQLRRKQLHHFLAYNQKSQTFKRVEAYLAAKGIATHPSFYSTSPEIILQLVLDQKGTAVLPYLLVKPYLGRALVPLHVDGKAVINRTLVSVQRKGRFIPPQALRLLGQAQQDLQLLKAEANAL